MYYFFLLSVTMQVIMLSTKIVLYIAEETMDEIYGKH
jgi:hypothetical protein